MEFRQILKTGWNEIRHNSGKQIKSIRVPILLILSFIIISVGFILFIHDYTNTPLKELTSDAHYIMKAKLYIGLLSNIGIIFWFTYFSRFVYSKL